MVFLACYNAYSSRHHWLDPLPFPPALLRHQSMPPYTSLQQSYFGRGLCTQLSGLNCNSSSRINSTVYFQAVKGTPILQSEVNFIPMTIGILMFAMAGGISLSKFGAYRPIHATMFVLSSLAACLFTLLDQGTPKVTWAIFEIINASLGMSFSTVLPAILASLPDTDVASANAAFSFIKVFGFVWGVTLPSIIFNAVFQKDLLHVTSIDLWTQIEDGGAYSFASQAHRIKKAVDPRQWNEVVKVYMDSLKAIWWLCLGISVLGLF